MTTTPGPGAPRAEKSAFTKVTRNQRHPGEALHASGLDLLLEATRDSSAKDGQSVALASKRARLTNDGRFCESTALAPPAIPHVKRPRTIRVPVSQPDSINALSSDHNVRLELPDSDQLPAVTEDVIKHATHIATEFDKFLEEMHHSTITHARIQKENHALREANTQLTEKMMNIVLEARREMLFLQGSLAKMQKEAEGAQHEIVVLKSGLAAADQREKQLHQQMLALHQRHHRHDAAPAASTSNQPPSPDRLADLARARADLDSALEALRHPGLGAIAPGR